MYNPNVPSSNMGIAPISGQPSQPLGPTPMVGSAPMGPMVAPPPMAPSMMGGMPPPPMMAPPPMAPPIAPITEGLGGFGGSRAGRAGFSERMQRMTSPPKPRPMPQPMPMSQPVQRMNMGGAVSSQGLSMYQPPMMPRPMANGGSVPRRTEISGQPHMLAYINLQEERLLRGLGGSGQPGPGGVPAYAREDGPGSDNFGTSASNYGYGSSGNSSDNDDDPFGTDDLLDSLGIPDFNPNKDFGGGGDDSGGDVVLRPPVPRPAPPVVVPEPASGGDGDDDIKNRILAEASRQVAGANNDIQLSDGTVLSESDLKPVVGTSGSVENLENISSLVSDLNAQLGNTGSIDAVGAAPVVGAGESGEGEGASTEVDVLGANPISLSSSGITDGFITDRFKGRTPREMIAAGPLLNNPNDVNVDISNIPAVDSDFTARRAGEILDSLNVARPDALNIALPGDIPTQSTQSFNIPNRVDAGRAALDLLRAKEKRGITSLSNIAEENADLQKELEILQGRVGERFANNIDEATSFYKPEGTGADALAQMLSDPVNYEINRVGRLSPEELAQSPFNMQTINGQSFTPPIGAPITDAELNEARKIYGDFDSTLGAPYVAPSSDIQLEMAPPTDGGYQPNLRRGPFGPIGEESSFPGDGRVDSLALPADTVFPEAEPEQIGGGLAGASTRPGMGSDDPIVYNDTPSGPVFTRPDGTVLTPEDSAAINAQARLDANPPTGFDTMALEEAAYPKGNIVDETFPQSPGDIFSTPSTDGSFQFSGLGDPLNGVTTDVSRIADDMRRVIGEDIQNPPKTLRQATGRAPMTSEEAAMNVSGIDSAGNVVSLAGASGYDSPAAAANRANALAQPATADPDGGGTDIFDSYAALTRSMKAPNKGETNLIRNAMAGARHTEDGPGYKKGDLVVEDRFADKLLSGFETALSFLLPGPMDFKAMSQENRNKALQAYKDTGKIVYEEGKPVGFEDKEGGLVRLVPKGRDDTGQDDGCPPGFRRINGVCTPIQRVAANPATAIEDAIASATLPSTLRPVVRDVVDDDDDDDEEETSDVGGLTIRRPKYFAGGGAVSEGMGSAIDSFISAMGGSVKKKSNVEPVNMVLGGFVGNKTTKDYSNNDYTDPYKELERDYGYDSTDPFGDGDTSYGDDSPSDTVTADTFIGPMQPNVTYQPPAAPVDTGGDDKRGTMGSFADELRFAREQTSPFSSIYAANKQLDKELADQGRKPLFGGILSKEPVYGTDTVRFEGLSGLKNLGVSMMDPIARAIDSSRASYMGLIPEQDMTGEALGLAGLTTLGGGMLKKPVVQTSTPKPANNVLPDATTPSEEAAKKVLELRSQGRSNEVTDPLYNAADRTYLEKNYPLDMSQQAKLARGSGMGFDVDNKYYHGSHTGKKIKNFNTGDLGSFFSNSPNVAGSYSPTRGGEKNLTEVFTRNNPEDFLIVEGRGNMYHDVPLDQIPDDITEGGTIFGFDPGDTSDTNFVSTLAKDQGYSGVEFRDIQDLGTKGPFSGYDPVSNVRTMFESTDIRSPNAIFDPEFAHLSNILAANKSKTAGLGAVSSSQTIQEMIDQLNKKAPLAEFENQKGQMVSGGLSGRQLDFALNNLARRLGIERPD